jgi:PadR family transcriptional regulator PadR
MMTEKLSFDDVLDDLMLEEETPSYEALVRWQERYPQYRKELANHFAIWAMQEARAQLPDRTEIDEKKLVQKGVDYAMEILRKQGRLLPDAPVRSLQPFDQLVLTAVYLLQGQGHAVNIAEKVGEMSETRALLGSILMSLDRLEEQHLVSSWVDESGNEPAGKARRYFRVTLRGERALACAKETSTVVARFLPDFA